VKPLVVDLFAGGFGWTAGFLAEGYRSVAFDIEHQPWHGPVPEGCDLVLQDVRTLHGSQFKDAAVIVASPPCQFFSYTAMPWSRAKALAAEVRSSAFRYEKELELFTTCFRIAQQASVPLIVENVKGAEPWVGRAKWHSGPYYFWGDVPALMPDNKWIKQGDDPSWFYDNYANSARRFGSHSKERKAWSASIAKIPPDLSRHVATCFKPI